MILIAAIVIGALAAYAVVVYVGGVEDRANDNAERIDVLRVAGEIPRGTRGQEAVDAGLIEVAQIAEEFVPPTAIRPTEQDVILRKAAVSDLAEGQVLVENMFVDPVNSQITAARRLTAGNVAITISVDDVRGVAGLIVPGDLVNIMVVSQAGCGSEVVDGDTGDGTTTPAAAPSVICQPARYLYQAASVLFVDNNPVLQPGEAATTNADGTTVAAINTGLITLQLPPVAAQYIASISPDGFYLTLLPEQYTPSPLPPIDAAVPLLPGEDAAQLTPCGPAGCDFDDTP
jgi:Flp pilus assembly protein CpaB